MANKELIFEGRVMYANLPPRQAQKGFESEDTSYSVQIETTEERFAELKKEGSPPLSQLKDFDGIKYLKLKATKTKTTKDGKFLEFKDIDVVDTNGDAITASIANGSRIKALVSLDEFKPGKKVLRLKAVVVTDLIVYNDSGLSKLGVAAKTPTVAKTATAQTTNSDDSFLGA